MGVDYSTTIGYGFPITDGQIAERHRSSEDYQEDGIGEFLECLFWGEEKNWPLLGCATLGSYYASGDDAVKYFIVVKRITQSFDAYDAPGGEFTVNNGDPTGEEYDQLADIYNYLTGSNEGFAPRPFAGGLWH